MFKLLTSLIFVLFQKQEIQRQKEDKERADIERKKLDEERKQREVRTFFSAF